MGFTNKIILPYHLKDLLVLYLFDLIFNKDTSGLLTVYLVDKIMDRVVQGWCFSCMGVFPYTSS